MDRYERRLDISDLATEQETEISQNPYKFLNLPSDATPEDARRSYIRLAKLYHPDMINPSLQTGELLKLYGRGDVKGDASGYSFDEIIAYLKKPPTDDAKLDAEQRNKILEDIRAAAHKKMILFNRAYQEIKSRYQPREWNQLFGYDFLEVQDVAHETIGGLHFVVQHNSGVPWRRVNLEGRGELNIYPNHSEYWVSGPYLSFDWARDPDHSWCDEDYQGSLNLRHMFAHLEMRDGKQVNPSLLAPFFDCFSLSRDQGNLFLDMLNDHKTTKQIMQRLNVSRDIKPDKDRDKWIYAIRFEKQLNDITTLDPWGEKDDSPTIELIDNGLRLEGETQTNFSEADYMLFVTLAYGPLLSTA